MHALEYRGILTIRRIGDATFHDCAHRTGSGSRKWRAI